MEAKHSSSHDLIQQNRFVTKKQLTELGVTYSRAHLLRLEKLGKFPCRIYFSQRRCGWKLSEILEYLNGKISQRELGGAN